MPRLHATPYDITYAGFFFESAEEFNARMQSAPFEEVEIQFIELLQDGPDLRHRCPGNRPAVIGPLGVTQPVDDAQGHQVREGPQLDSLG